MIKIRIDPEINGFALLRHAIIKQAVEDYQLALRGKKVFLDKTNYPPSRMIADCESFFNSDFCASLVGADASVIIWQAREIAKKEDAYRSLDPDRIRKNLAMKENSDDITLLKEAHKYIANCDFSTPQERRASAKWLREHGVRQYKEQRRVRDNY